MTSTSIRRTIVSLVAFGAAAVALAPAASAAEIHPNIHTNGPLAVAPAIHGTVDSPIHLLRKTGIKPMKRI